MIRLMNGDKPVARLVNEQVFPLMRAYDGVGWFELPVTLFGYKPWGATKREVPYADFLKWAEERCFPPDRVDADDVLKMLGLKKYNRYDIILRTGARLVFVDPFWVDFGELAVKID